MNMNMNKLSLFLRLCACVCARARRFSLLLFILPTSRVFSPSRYKRERERERERERKGLEFFFETKNFGQFFFAKKNTRENRYRYRYRYRCKKHLAFFLSFFLSFFREKKRARVVSFFLSFFLARPSSSSFVVVGTESESSSRGARRWRRRGSHVETRPYFCSFALRLVCRPLRDAGRARRCRCRGRVVSSPERDRKREDCNLSTTFEWFFLSTRSVATKRRRKRKKRKRHL